MKKIIRKLIVIIFLFNVFFSFKINDILFSTSLQYTDSEHKKWTLMYYFCGDNNLENGFISAINSLEKKVDPSQMNIIALFDRSPEHSTASNNWTEARLLLITNNRSNKIKSIILENWGEVSMDNYIILRRFVSYCLANFSSDYYVLNINNHGGGIVGGICEDDSSQITDDDYNTLSLHELSQAIENGILPYISKLDLINLRACNMGNLEIAYQLRDLTDYLIFSEESSYSDKRLFSNEIQYLVNNPECTVIDYAKEYIDIYEKVNHGFFRRITRDTTLSLIDCRNFTNILTKLENLVINLFQLIENGLSADIMTTRFNTQDFYSHLYIDLIHFLDNLILSNNIINFQPNILEIVKDLKSEFAKIIIKNYQDYNYKDTANGISIFFPYPDYNHFESYISDYIAKSSYMQEIDFLYDSSYKNFINALFFIDSDNDNLKDWFELNYGLNPLSNDTNLNHVLDGNEDIDKDGLSNNSEQFFGSNPLEIDTDSDRLTDKKEILGILKPRNPGANYNGYVFSLPYDMDSDDDGNSDYQEIMYYNTDPLDNTNLVNSYALGIIVFCLSSLFLIIPISGYKEKGP